MSVITGTDKAETINDTGVNSSIYGLGGDDKIYGLAGNDRLDGGTGNDLLFGGAGDDSLSGGYGSDTLYGNDGNDWLLGDAGNDVLDGGAGWDGVSYLTSFGAVRVALDKSFAPSANANDTLISIEKLEGSHFNDVLAGNSGRNYIFGDAGADKIYGRGGDDYLYGGDGADSLYGEAGNDVLTGSSVRGKLLDGGTGRDTASYYDTSIVHGVVASLDHSLDLASGDGVDSFVSIENLEGYQFNDRLAGNGGNNTLWGNGGADTLYGRGGEDRIFGGNGNDHILGEAGDDYLVGGLGRDNLNGGDGTDQISYYESAGVKVALDGSLMATGEAIGDTFISIEQVEGSLTGSDVVSGNAANNTIWVYGGNDTVYGRGGTDFILGGTGNDVLYGGEGNDNLNGEAGRDVLNGGNGNDYASYYYYAGAITVSLDGSLTATGDAIGDRYVLIEGLEGSKTGSDTLAGDAANNDLYGQGGNDTLYGRAGDDYINAGTGNDKLYGEAGDDSLESDAGNDYFNGGAGWDYAGYFGASAVTASLDGSLVARGAATGDTYVSIENLAGSDTGNDILAGNAGKNELWGGGGDDTLYGRAGDDRLYGNAGADTLYGEAGNDIFAFKFPDDGADQIMDFTAGDKIGIRTDQFTGFTPGSLTAEQFQSGTDHTAATDTVRFLYDQTDNSLWYDADGNGAAAAVELALLKNGFVLGAGDFILLPAG